MDPWGRKMVRTEKWKLIFDAKKNNGQLFDEVTDPGEDKNLYSSSEHQSVVCDMKALLEKGWKAQMPSKN